MPLRVETKQALAVLRSNDRMRQINGQTGKLEEFRSELAEEANQAGSGPQNNKHK